MLLHETHHMSLEGSYDTISPYPLTEFTSYFIDVEASSLPIEARHKNDIISQKTPFTMFEFG